MLLLTEVARGAALFSFHVAQQELDFVHTVSQRCLGHRKHFVTFMREARARDNNLGIICTREIVEFQYSRIADLD